MCVCACAFPWRCSNQTSSLNSSKIDGVIATIVSQGLPEHCVMRPDGRPVFDQRAHVKRTQSIVKVGTITWQLGRAGDRQQPSKLPLITLRLERQPEQLPQPGSHRSQLQETISTRIPSRTSCWVPELSPKSLGFVEPFSGSTS